MTTGMVTKCTVLLRKHAQHRNSVCGWLRRKGLKTRHEFSLKNKRSTGLSNFHKRSMRELAGAEQVLVID